MTRTRRSWRWAASLALAGSLVVQAAAQVVNGSFEDSGGSFSGWGTIGKTLVLNNTLGSGPTDGTYQAFMASATDGTINPAVTPGLGVSGASLETFLGVNSGTLAGVGNGTPLLGSGIVQAVTVVAGDRVLFDWNFLTNQTFNDGTNFSVAPSTANNDFAFFTAAPLGSPALGQIGMLADTFFGYVNNPGAPGGFETGFTITDPNNPFISETGFNTTMWTAPSSGTFLLGMGVVHVTNGPDNGVNSALLVDNVRLAPVPEPVTTLAMLAALGGGVLHRRRRLAK